MQNRPPFDAKRAVLEDILDDSLYPARLETSESYRLEDALHTGQVSPDTPLLTFEYYDQLHAVPMPVVLSYNVIQGQTNGQAWMMTFCNACNTGVVFDPTVEGQIHHFLRRGSYDGLMLISDEETYSYWHHITGVCMYGQSEGKQLTQLANTRQMTVGEIIARQQNTVLLTTTLSEAQQKLSRFTEKMRANPERVEAGIMATVSEEDTRRPRFELGLGVWNKEMSIFFPLVMLHMYNNALITTFDNRPLLIYQTPDAIAPVAAFVETQQTWWEGDVLRLSNGASVQNDQFVMANGMVCPLERPNQLLMRWYGFALTFPGCSLPEVLV